MDVWKKNILENLEAGLLEYKIVGEFLMDIRKEFREGNKKSTKIAKLKRLEQRRKTIEEFVQESSKREQIWEMPPNKGVQERNKQDDQEEVNGGRKTSNKHSVIRWVCGQTLGLGLVNKNRTVVLLLVYNRKMACDLEVMWQSLEQSRRIEKSLERVRVRSNIKGHKFLMVYIWYMYSDGD